MAVRGIGGAGASLGRVLRWPLAFAGRVVGTLFAAGDGYFAHRLPQHAAGIAYRVLFSLAPLTIVLVSIVGVVLQDDELRDRAIDLVVGWLPFTPEGQSSVEQAITTLASPSSALGLISLGVFAWAATGMMASLRTGLEAAFGVVVRRPAARGKLVDFILVAAAGMLVIAMIAIAVVTQIVARFVDDVAGKIDLGTGFVAEVFRSGVPIGVAIVVTVLLYRFVPTRSVGFRDAVAGGVLTGILIVLISGASAVIYDKVANLSVVYGSITAILVFLYSVYLYASAILFGAEFAAAWSRPPDAETAVPVKERILGGIVGLFVHRDPPGDSPKPGAGSR